MFDIKKFSKKVVVFSFLLLIIFGVFSINVFASANDNFGQDFIGNEINLSTKDPRTIASQIINVSLSILGIVAVVIVIYGGFVWMSSEGNEEKISKAKGILKSGVIGLAIILSAWGITSLVFKQLGDATGTVGSLYCDDGSIKACGCGGISTCANNSWGPCVGSSCLPGSEGSSCSSGLGNSCLPDNTLCNPNLFCSDECKCTQQGVGDPCGELVEGVCNNEVEPFCSNPNLVCDSNTCTCQSKNEEDENFSELGEPCGDGIEGVCQSDGVCNPNHGLSCESCVCVGSPIITGISPVGGFCQNDINTSCDQDDDCSSGVCNKITPNASAGNFITIRGYNFDEYNEFLSGVNFINEENDSLIPGIMPSTVNSYCGNTWSNSQIIVSLPNGFNVSDNVLVEVVTQAGKKDRSNDENGAVLESIKINSIARPGLCRIDPTEAKSNDSVLYYGVNLNNSKAYFGNYANNVSGFAPNNFDDNLFGTVMAPNIKTGDTNTFAKKIGLDIPSNFLDFKKLPEPPKAPSISFFEPSTGRSGQYITIYGSGFGSSRGDNQVYFYNSNDIEASFNFPEVCLHSVWRDDQIIVKVPDNIDYNNSDYKLKLKIGTWDDVVSADSFVASSTYALLPSLCKISPYSGPAGTTKVSFWGEYFSENSQETRAIFSNNKTSENLNIVFEDGADKTEALVVEDSITGPVKISRGSLIGNGLNFNVKSCASDSDCSGGEVCCGSKTTNPGACVTNINDCLSGSPKSSVFEWGFDTGFDGGNLDEDDNVFSCADYNFCPTGYVCPNSPGFCSSYDGGNIVKVGVCQDNCSSFDYCGESGENCEYNSETDKCIVKNISCSKNISYNLGDGIGTVNKLAVCQKYNIDGVGERSFYEISTQTVCPKIDGVQWTMIANDKCVDVDSVYSSSTCSVCPSGSLCTNEGFCSSEKLCPAGSDCVLDECIKTDKASCDCCCEIDKNVDTGSAIGNPACCSPLVCSYSCGISANPGTENTNFGLCSGCGEVPGNYLAQDLACNCVGTSGKYCETNTQYPSGVCLDCTSLGESFCKEHNATCCWDEVNNVCRGGLGDSSVWGEGSANIGSCPYYKCDTEDSTLCSNEISVIGDYKNKEACDISCNENCKQLTDASSCVSNNSCCWDAKSSVCSSGVRFETGETGGPVGYCKRYDCNENKDACAIGYPNTSGEYLKLSLCESSCENLPAGFGEKCVNNIIDDSNVCADVCNKLDCLSDNGSLGTAPDCGACCCNPVAAEDQCSVINDKLSCYKDKGNCSGDNRGLCCGCSGDSDCVSAGLDPANVGCGFDTCCQARPQVIETSPYNKQEGVCHNASISITFDQRIESLSIDGNVLLLEESSGTCSSGTYFISHKEKLNFIDKIKNLFIYKPLYYLGKILKTNVLAATNPFGDDLSVPTYIASSDKVYCSVLGSTEARLNPDGRSVVIFSPKNLLKEGTKYFVVVKGDVDLDSSSGVLNYQGVGMNGRGFSVNETVWVEGIDSRLKFNNLNFSNSHIFGFKTMDEPADQGGICSVEEVLVSPDSYLFSESANSIKENDNDPNSSSFDSEKDQDKVYYAYALSSDKQVLQPVPEYSWDWEWKIGDPLVLEFKDDVVSWMADGDKRLLAVKENIRDDQTSVSATVKMDSSNITLNGNNTSGSVMAYVFVCKNPWPPVKSDGTWLPWSDVDTAFGGYNYEFYYCRDSGDETTSDDLPAFLSDLAVVKGPVKICDNFPGKTCSTDSDCPSGGICIFNILQETYFFKERIPRFINNVSVVDIGLGGSLRLNWQSDVSLVDKYKIYYKPNDEEVFQEEIIDLPHDGCLIEDDKYNCEYTLNGLLNYIPYDIKITALSENLAETNFSSTVSATPTEANLSAKPTNPKIEILSHDERLIKISWTAPAGEVSKYKIYRGSVAGVYGTSVLTADDSTEATISLAGTQNDTFYFVISSINPVGQESEKSSEVFVYFNDPSVSLFEYIFDNIDFESIVIGGIPSGWSKTAYQYAQVGATDLFSNSGSKSMLIKQDQGHPYPGVCGKDLCLLMSSCSWSDANRTCTFSSKDDCNPNSPAVYPEGKTFCWGNTNRVMWVSLVYDLLQLDFKENQKYAVKFNYRGNAATNVLVKITPSPGWDNQCISMASSSSNPLRSPFKWIDGAVSPVPQPGENPCNPSYGSPCAEQANVCCVQSPAQTKCYSGVASKSISSGIYSEWQTFFQTFEYNDKMSLWLTRDYNKMIRLSISMSYADTVAMGSDFYIDDFSLIKIS